MKHTRKRTLVWATDAISGEPIGGAHVRLWSTVKKEKTTYWQGRDAETNGEGLATAEWGEPADWVTAMVAKGDRHAYAASGAFGQATKDETWRVFAFSDRPAYRPGETVKWKAIARTFDGTSYETPSGRELGYAIFGPKGAKVSEGTLTLNAFGSGWASLDLAADLPLGEYHVGFLPGPKGPGYFGYETPALFRVEEYKLPEFRVTVETPTEGGRRKVFRHGDRVETVVRAAHYSGAPVVGANVEVLVSKRGYQFHWDEPEMLSWYGERRFGSLHESGKVVERLTARTGSDGSATVSFDTKKDEYQDVEYGIEARVTDGSRREVMAEGRIRVARQLFFARLKLARNLCRPGEAVTLRVETRDANEQPVPGAGVLTVTRQTWDEEWIDPSGKTWRGEELRQTQEKLPGYGFYNVPGWRGVSRDYKKETVVSGRVGTSPEGVLEVPFTPDREGYYAVTFAPEDGQGGSTGPATGLWATRRETLDLGYQPSTGLELITDRQSYRPGDVAQVLVTARSANRWLLFTTEADAVESVRVLKMTGDVTLLDVLIDEKLTPNAALTATSIREGKVLLASKELLVPPLQHFLDLSVRPSRDDVRPGQELTLELTARDHLGKPVAAELGVGVVDDSVSYVQKDLAGDPRPFFHGTKRTARVQTQTGMQKIYTRFVAGLDGKLEDEAVAALRARAAPMPVPVPTPGWGAAAGGPSTFVGIQHTGPAGLAFASAAMSVESAYVIAEAPVISGAKATSVARDQARGPLVQVRTDFRSTAFWQPDVLTDAQGRATITVKVPDSLTTWKATARGSTAGDQYGVVSSSFRTNLPLMVRLESPRFLVVGDTATISAVIENATSRPVSVRPSFEAPGLEVTGVAPETITVPGNGSARVDWAVVARSPDEVPIKVVAQGEGESDAMEWRMPVHEHGIEKLVSTAEKMAGADAATILGLTLPAERRNATMTVQVEPSLAGPMLGALPYLLDYPYGCVEQTMSRFLPAAVVRKTLTELGVPAEAVSARVLSRAALVDETGAPRVPRDPRELDRIVDTGLARLSDMQHEDGGWGWWKDDASDAYMTAYVVWGLSLAKAAGIQVKDELLSKGAASLASSLENADLGLETRAWLLHALAHVPPRLRAEAAPRVRRTFDGLWERRARLGSYSLALLTLAAHELGHHAAADTLARNLKNGAKRDGIDVSKIASRASGRSSGSATSTAHWGEERGWHWWESRVETTAFALRALVAVDPEDELIEPAAAWLVRNRRAGRFTNTRDTAIAVLALDEVLASRKRLAPVPDDSYEVLVNGTPVAQRSLAGTEALLADGRVDVDPALLRDGRNEVRVRRTGGTGPLWVSASARFFSLEEPIAEAGSGLFVRRRYFRMKPVKSLLKGTLFEREELSDGAEVVSGERIETIVTLESKNDYEYLLVEDLKPAGLEAVQVRSGEALVARELNGEGIERKHGIAGRKPVARDPSKTTHADTTERTEPVHQELRDRKIALFLTRLPEGVWEVRYDLRAEAPGRFHALPLIGQAMYAPDLRGNGDEQRITVRERPE